MKKTSSIVVKGIIFSLFPAICSVLGSSDTLDKLQVGGYIGPNVDIGQLKNFSIVLSVFLTFILLTVNLIISEIEENKYKKQARQLIKYNKDILVSTLSEYVGKEYCDLNIRIFVPYKNISWIVGKVFPQFRKKWFCIKNEEGIAEAGITDNLKFLVEPFEKREGLVGECYYQRKMVYDDNLENTNEVEYNLSEYQVNKTRNLKFIIACPTFSKDKEIDAIVAFDSTNTIKLENGNDKFTDAILNYTQQLHEYVPELFKPKGGFL